MQACESISCGQHSGVWWVVHHQWYVACPSWGRDALVLASTAVACTHVLRCKTLQIHSPHMPTFCCTTPNRWQEDLVNGHHELVSCFVTTPYIFPFQPRMFPLLSQTIISSHLHFFTVDNLGWSSRLIWWLQQASHSFLPFQWLIVWGFQFCEVSMEPFFFFIIICVKSFDIWCISDGMLCHECNYWILFDVYAK